jgi:hypothetical protein
MGSTVGQNRRKRLPHAGHLTAHSITPALDNFVLRLVSQLIGRMVQVRQGRVTNINLSSLGRSLSPSPRRKGRWGLPPSDSYFAAMETLAVQQLCRS